MKDKEKTAYILQALKADHLIANHITISEFRFGSSFNGGVSQRQIDLFAIDTRRGQETISFEIKVSRGDFQNDMKNDLKQRGARLFSNYFYYCTPKGLLKPEEIPLWAGLIEFDLDKNITDYSSYQRRDITIVAPLLERHKPTWGMFISLIRRAKESEAK